jgi:hypothetical protein
MAPVRNKERRDLVAFVAPLCSEALRIATSQLPDNSLAFWKILQLSDAPIPYLWCHSKRRYIRHKVEALNPALRKMGTQEGVGSQ